MSEVKELHPLTTIMGKLKAGDELDEHEQHFLDLEKMDWEDFDLTVKQGARTFVKVGVALKEIKERKLHKFAEMTFEQYLNSRLGMSRSQGYRLMDTGSLAYVMDEKVENWKPTYESHVRVLLPLKDKPEVAAEIMTKATQKAKEEGKPLSAGVIKKVAREIEPDIFKDSPKPKPKLNLKEELRAAIESGDKELALELLGKL